MVGLTELVDIQATTNNLRSKKCPIAGISLKLYRQVLMTVISGSGRAGDRLHAAGLADTDQCDKDKCRDTFEHMIWTCSKYEDTRKPYLDAIYKMRIDTGRNLGCYSQKCLDDIIGLQVFRHCGICPDDPVVCRIRQERNQCDLSLQQPTVIEDCFKYDIHGARYHQEGEHDYIIVYTDGSKANGHSYWLMQAGWSIYVAPNCDGNVSEKLQGSTVDVFRAELRAITEAIRRSGIPTWIRSDCLSAVNMVNDVLDNKCYDVQHQDADLLNIISQIVKDLPKNFVRVTWVPAHLLDEGYETKLRKYREDGGMNLIYWEMNKQTNLLNLLQNPTTFQQHVLLR